jgi:hypothetical protein
MLDILVQKLRSSLRGSRVPLLIPARHCTTIADLCHIYKSVGSRQVYRGEDLTGIAVCDGATA